MVELARFGARRYAGRLRPFLVAASPRRLLDARPPRHRAAQLLVPARGTGELAEAIRRSLRLAGWEGGLEAGAPVPAGVVLRLPPTAPRLPVVTEALAGLAGRGGLLVLVPERHEVEILAARLGRLGVPAARFPEEWGAAAAGAAVVVGSRAAWSAPLPQLGGIVVLDAQSQAYTEERAPTWDAVVLARERARRARVPFLAASPAPSLELLAAGELVRLPPALERSRWPSLEVLDRRGDDPRTGRYAERLAPAIAAARVAHPALPVVCVLNRTGRARLLACSACGELARCETCGSALAQPEAPGPGAPGMLACPACGRTRPLVSAACGSTRLRLLRVGVARAAEELAALTGLPAEAVAGADTGAPLPDAPVLVGTEAVLHRARRASLVVFLDLDSDLFAPRLRAGERALELLALAGRLVGGRPAGRVLVQTRVPDHEVLRAAGEGDPGVLAEAEGSRRRLLGLPPYRALAALTGPDAGTLAAALAEEQGCEVAEAAPGRFLVRADDHDQLADALARGGAGGLDLRVEVDPVGL